MIVMNNFRPDIRVLKEAKSSAACGYHLKIIAMKSSNIPDEESIEGITVKRLKLWSREIVPFNIKLLFIFEFILKSVIETLKLSPDIIHTHDLSALPSGWLSAKLSKAKLVYDSHEFWLGQDKPLVSTGLGKWLLKQVEGFFIRRVDAVITINQAIAQQLSEIYGIAQPTVVMNAQPLTNPPQSDKLRAALGVDASTRIIIYAAGIRPGRGLERLIDSARYFEENTMLVLMGPDRMEGELQRYTKRQGLQSHVRFLPPVPENDVAEYVAGADVGIIAVPSTSMNRYFGLGNKIFHYIAAGVPIAVSNQPERRRIVEEYEIGIVFDENDPQDIAAKTQALLRDPGMYQELRQRAQEAHLSHLNWETEAEKLVQVYERLITE